MQQPKCLRWVSMTLMLAGWTTPGQSAGEPEHPITAEAAAPPTSAPVATVPAALAGLPPYPRGDGVDWVAALRAGRIAPRADLAGQAQPLVMDLDLVIAANGSIPDVPFSHRSHTEWLACTNCHRAIFEPEKGANAMTMSAIAEGQYCGVCHGTVAFPIDDCARCHSAGKPPAEAR